MSKTLEDFRRPDGRIDGPKALAFITGLSEAEVSWTALRIKQLMVVEKVPREEAVATVKAERKAKPWLKPAGDAR
jgi:hypothetical protein